jgi:hypothetical protein
MDCKEFLEKFKDFLSEEEIIEIRESVKDMIYYPGLLKKGSIDTVKIDDCEEREKSDRKE